MRIGLYVDVPNLFPSAMICGHAAGMKRPRVDFVRLKRWVEQHGSVSVAVMYAIIRERGKKDDFVARMRRSGFDIRAKEVRGEKQLASWESGIGMQMLADKDQWDSCILCSGNGALSPFVDVLVRAGKRVGLVVFPDAASPALVVSATDTRWLGVEDLFDAQEGDGERPAARG